MNYIRRFKNSIISILALIMYALCLAILLVLLGIENWQILGLSRTSIIMVFTFTIMGFLLVILTQRPVFGAVARPFGIYLAAHLAACAIGAGVFAWLCARKRVLEQLQAKE